jgi:phytol kinase
MFAVIACLAGIGILLVLAEVLWRKKILKGEGQRKFLHITGGTYIAFWPWMVSMRTIQLIGAAMLIGVMINRGSRTKLHFLRGPKRESYGDVFFALVVMLCALLTDVKLFFAIAILHLALADGFAAVVGKNFGKRWTYKVFHQTKTVVGSMTFWFISLCILGAGMLIDTNLISYDNYVLLLIFLPPVLTIMENVVGFGLDNIVIPIAVLVALHIAQTA